MSQEMRSSDNLLFLPILALAALLSACATDEAAGKLKLMASGNQHFERGQYREAVSRYTAAIELDRRFGEAYYRLALAEMGAGRPVNASRALHRAVELQPGNGDAFARLCAIYLGAARLDRPMRERHLLELRELLAQADEAGTERLEVLTVRGDVAIVQEQFDLAVNSYRRALNLRPDSRQLMTSLVRALTANGDFDQAAGIAYAALGKEPGLEQMYDEIYLIHVVQQDYQAAGAVIARKCETTPEVVDCRIQLARHYHCTGNVKKRDETLAAIDSMPNKSPAEWTRLANFHERVGSFSTALEQHRLAGEAHPDSKTYHQLRSAEVLAQAGRGPEAVGLVEEVLKAEPDNKWAVSLHSALQLYGGETEMIQPAILNLQATISDMPKNPVLRYRLGLAYLSAGDPAKATVQFQAAAALHPDHPGSRYQLGRVYLANGQPAMAARLADEIIANNPRSIRARLLRADASIRLREYHQARANLESVLRTSPADTGALILLNLLRAREQHR